MGQLDDLWLRIKVISRRYKLDPFLVGAIVICESGGQVSAVRYEKHVGRYVNNVHLRPSTCSLETEKRLQMFSFGPMQVMGFNIRHMGFRGWLTAYASDALGLEVGCKHLAGLFKRWSNVWDVVSAYNQGSPRRGKDGKYRNQAYVTKVRRQYTRLKNSRG